MYRGSPISSEVSFLGILSVAISFALIIVIKGYKLFKIEVVLYNTYLVVYKTLNHYESNSFVIQLAISSLIFVVLLYFIIFFVRTHKITE